MSAPPLIVTTSWDDGYPADLRLAELLARYNIAGTFYVPRHNREGRDVIPPQDLTALSKVFEIGGHTVDHVTLTTLDPTAAARQIQDCKAWLEDVTGGPIRGFCYPRGGYDRTIKALTRRAGFAYARTTKYFCSSVGDDPFEIPTTLQLFPHTKFVFLKNFLKFRPYRSRARIFAAALTTRSLMQRVKEIAAICAVRGGVFHLWGHSWEIEEHGLWNELEEVLKYLSQEFNNVEFLDNGQVFSKYFDSQNENRFRLS